MSKERFIERQANVRDSATRLPEAVAQPESAMGKLALRETDLAVLRRTLHRFPWVRDARVFGSRATGNARRASDIDLAISAPDATASQWFELIDAIEEAPIIYEFDVVRTDHAQNARLMQKIVSEGLSIYPELTRSP